VSPTLQTLVPVAAGIATVLVAILVLRLHAFLALLLAAAVTAGLTPPERLDVEALRDAGHVADFLGIERPAIYGPERVKFQYVLHDPTDYEGRGQVFKGTPIAVRRTSARYVRDEWVVIDPQKYAESGEIKATLWIRGSVIRNRYSKPERVLVLCHP
jgi:hypothetical protein